MMKKSTTLKAQRALKKRSLPKLRDDLDKVFSQFIRLRDSSNGMCKCISCPKTGLIKDFHAGHYISRRHFSVRWDEKNVHAQCVGCNIFNQGNSPAYALALVRKYGENILETLDIKKNNISKMRRFEYELLIMEYREKVKSLQSPTHESM